MRQAGAGRALVYHRRDFEGTTMKTLILTAAFAALAATPVLAAPSITLYSAPNYQGHSITLDHPVRDLDHHDWDFGDRAQSARVHGHWLVCAAKNFQGDCVTLN